MNDVAALAGVGMKTVSRVVNGERYVSAAMAERVDKAARELGYEINQVAGNLRRSDQRTATIGAIMAQIANPFSAEILAGIEHILSDHGYAVFSASLNDDPDREYNLYREFLRRRVDGMIITPIASDQTYLTPELERNLPVVFVDRIPHGVSADAVVGDNLGGAARATRHLIAAGHRRIAFLGDRETLWTAQQRHRGYREELERAGISYDERYVVHDVRSPEQGRAQVTRLLAQPEPPTALFAAQNLITIGALHALRDSRLTDRVAVVSFDDMPLADLLSPGLTVVTQHPFEIGVRAGERLLARLQGDRGDAQTVTVATPLISRGSGEIPNPWR